MKRTVLDANIILRYLLNDNAQLAAQAEEMVRSENAAVTIEVMAEVVYVLKGVYQVERQMIAHALLEFLKEVPATEPEVLKKGLQIYAVHSLDFVDCILYAYQQVMDWEIRTFDRKLQKLLQQPEPEI